MFLGNLNRRAGLCNGTGLIVKKLYPNLICAEIATGRKTGVNVLTPRIGIRFHEGYLRTPFTLNRRQFPVAFAMKINKSPGQRMESVSIYLPDPGSIVCCDFQSYTENKNLRAWSSNKEYCLSQSFNLVEKRFTSNTIIDILTLNNPVCTYDETS